MASPPSANDVATAVIELAANPDQSKGKAFAAIDGGHYACFTDTDQFLAAMRKYVLPLTR